MIPMFRIILTALLLSLATTAAAQSSECEIVLLPEGGTAVEGQFADATAFLDSVYDGEDGYLKTTADLPIRAVICQREDLIPTMRDLPILKTGLPLSVSQNFESTTSGLLTLYDAGADYKADYSGPPLSPQDEEKLRNTLEIFNFQKFVK